MSTLTIRLVPEGRTEAETSRLSSELQRLIRNDLPAAQVSTARTDSEAMEAGSMLIVALSHIAITAFIEIAKTYWDLHPGTRVKIQAKDGTMLSFQGVSAEFEQTIQKLAVGVTGKKE